MLKYLVNIQISVFLPSFDMSYFLSREYFESHQSKISRKLILILPEREPICVWASHQSRPPTRVFRMTYKNMWVSKNLGDQTPTPTNPTQAPIRACGIWSCWVLFALGSFRVGLVNFLLFVYHFQALGSQR